MKRKKPSEPVKPLATTVSAVHRRVMEQLAKCRDPLIAGWARRLREHDDTRVPRRERRRKKRCASAVVAMEKASKQRSKAKSPITRP